MENSKRKIWLMVVPALLMLMLVPLILAGCGGSKTNLKLTTPFNKTEYYLGEELNVNGGVLTYTDENGEENVVIVEESFVTGFDSSTPGTKMMTIIYENKTVSVSYVVKNFRLGEYLATGMLDSDGAPIDSELPYMAMTFNSNGSMILSQQLDIEDPSSIESVTYEFSVNIEGNIEIRQGDDTGTAHNLTVHYLNDCVYLDYPHPYLGTATVVFEYVA